MASVMILADLHDGKRAWNRETSTYSLTSGPRSPTKMLYSGPRSSLSCMSVYHNNCRDSITNVPTIHKTTARCPVKLELARRVGHRSSVERESLVSSLRSSKFDEAVASVARKSQFPISNRKVMRLTQSSCRE